MNYRHKLLILVSVLLATSCVRYIESRKQLIERYGVDPAAKRVGIEGFNRYEVEQRKRLEQLIKEREVKLKNNPNTGYRIGAGDEVKIAIKNFEEVSKTYTVGADGKIRIPFVGSVSLKGLSEDSAASQISKLVKDFVVNPLVDVEITKFASNLIWVLDNSARDRNNYNTTLSQNAFPLKYVGYTLFDLLLELKGTSYFDSGVIYLYPQIGTANVLDGKANPPANVSANNVSLTDRFNSFAPAKWSQQGANYEICGENLDHTDTNMVKACTPKNPNLSDAEVSSKYANQARIAIDVEELFGGVTKQPIKIPLEPGDLVYIPPAPSIQIYGEVFQKGTLSAGSGGGSASGSGGSNIKPTLLSAIAGARGLTYAADIGNVEIYRELEFGNKSVIGIDLEKVVFLGAQDFKLRDGDIILVPSKHKRFYEDTTINAINSFASTILNVDSTNDNLSN